MGGRGVRRNREMVGQIGNGRRFRTARACLAVMVLLVAVALNASTARAVHDDGVFELEGNLVDNAAAGDDWVTLQGGGGSSTAFTGVLNDRVGDTTYFNGGGSKDIYDIPSWGSNGNSAPPKDEITNTYAASYTVGTHHVIYFGVDRGATNGDSQMGFWFFQNSVGVSGSGFSETHVARDTANGINGDLLVLSDFTKGGKVGSVKVYEWVGDGSGSDGNLDLILTEDNTTGGNPQCGGLPQPTPDDSVCAIENPTSVSVPTGWSYSGSTFSKGAFLEGGIDVTELFPGTNSCFASFQAETRSSQEPNATLKDFRNGSFEACFPTTVLTAGAASPAVIHNGETSTVRFTETNDGNVSLTEPANGWFECSSDAGTAAVTPVETTPGVNDGDTNLDGVLDPDEGFLFDCTVSGLSGVSGTVTITGTGHGIDPNTGDDITYPGDGEEQTTATFSVINPSTTMGSSVSAVVTYTFTETNNGEGPLSRVDATAANNFVRSSDCTITETTSGGFNVGDTNSNNTLDVGETWTFTCQRTFTTTGSNSTVANGHGTDAATSGKDVRWCNTTDQANPPAGTFCDQDEQQSITVTIANP